MDVYEFFFGILAQAAIGISSHISAMDPSSTTTTNMGSPSLYSSSITSASTPATTSLIPQVVSSSLCS
ncbi:conserved hypothetical protein [Ricinus communis]|uniref:Uncharacterized protein n=1 Tax=Ricinus communis TaxID=3988 RepID=B9SY03_RICCO|nr:conserved hypothetical protein [Ricinus communis]